MTSGVFVIRAGGTQGAGRERAISFSGNGNAGLGSETGIEVGPAVATTHEGVGVGAAACFA